MSVRRLEYIDYNSSFLVNIKELDLQHERLFVIYNRFVDAHNSGSSVTMDAVDRVFNEMFWYTKYHFREEEWLLRTYNYPKARAHVERHQEIISTLTNIYQESQNVDQMIQLLDDFIDIWAAHILEYDSQYAEFINNY